jgi:ABC-type antimicrobial peptide transport system permease subunit
VLSDSLLPVLGGLGAGCAAGFALVRAAQDILYAVSISDPYLSAVAAAGVSLTGLVASLIPTFRALHVDPAQALREN